MLLSHCDILHLGNVPRLVGKFGVTAPVYVTAPVHKMGQMYLYDYYLARTEYDESFDEFSLDDVDAAFGRFVPLKYSQTMSLSGRGTGISITAFPSGHLLGGTIWRISKEGEEIVYAVDYNHRRDRHLNACALERFNRPAVLITDAFSALTPPSPNRKGLDTAFLDRVVRTLRQSGNVLMPVDTAGRVLELLLVLDQHWTQSRLGAYPIVLLTNVAYNTLEFARSQLEWMSDAVTRAFEQLRENAFACRHVQLCHSLAEVDALPPGPKVVLSSMPTLDFGAARELFAEWARDDRNAVIFTSRPRVEGSLAWRVQTRGERRFSLRVSRRVPLEGAELEAHLAKKRREEEREEEERQRAAKAEAAAGGEGDAPEGAGEGMQVDAAGEKGGADEKKEEEEEEEEEDDDEDEEMPEAEMKRAVEWSQRREADPGVVFVDGFEPPDDAVVPMFGDPAEEPKWDEYGVLGDPMDFVGSRADKRELQAVGAIGGGEEAGLDAAAMDMEVPSRAAAEVPTKVVSREVDVEVRCSVQYMDYVGLADGRSIRNIIARVGPHSLILVHGSPEATDNIRQYCLDAKVVPAEKIYAPGLNEAVDASSDIVSYKVNLSDALLSSLSLTTLGEYEVGWLEATIREGNPPLLDMREGAAEGGAGRPALFIGDPKLSDFRQLLQSRGIGADFADGVLVCGARGAVMVRRNGENLALEGSMCEEYFAVRELLYSQYHTLAR